MITEHLGRSTDILRLLSFELLNGKWVKATIDLWILFQIKIHNTNCSQLYFLSQKCDNG